MAKDGPCRKHRFYIDVTYSKPVEYREAAYGLRLVLDRLDLSVPVWAFTSSPRIEKLVVTEVK